MPDYIKKIFSYIKNNPKVWLTESTTMIGIGAIGLAGYESYTGLFTTDQATGIAVFGVGLLFPESDSKEERLKHIVSSAIVAISYMHATSDSQEVTDSKKK